MCKINTSRKYQNYKIKITYNNGDIEDINFKDVNSSSYKEMLEVYKGIKEEHKEDSCIIDFLGENEEKEVGVLFTKEINIKTSSEKLDTKAIEIGKELERLLSLLVEKKGYHNPIVQAEQKKQDLLLHKIQYIIQENIPIELEAKANMFNEIGNIRIDREFHKTENSHLDCYFSKFNVSDLLNKIKNINSNINKGNTGVDFSEENLNQYNIMKEKHYNTEKERIALMSQWKPKYVKVVVDEAKKLITAFNYGYTNNGNKKEI